MQTWNVPSFCPFGFYVKTPPAVKGFNSLMHSRRLYRITWAAHFSITDIIRAQKGILTATHVSKTEICWHKDWSTAPPCGTAAWLSSRQSSWKLSSPRLCTPYSARTTCQPLLPGRWLGWSSSPWGGRGGLSPSVSRLSSILDTANFFQETKWKVKPVRNSAARFEQRFKSPWIKFKTPLVSSRTPFDT